MREIYALLLAITMMIMVIHSPICEGFALQPMKGDKVTMLDDYNEKKDPRLTDNGSQQIYTNYPVFPADSCKNNNIRYWRRPTNGKCSPADICGSLYDTTEQDIPILPLPPPWGGNTRVNYYASCVV